MTTAEFFFQTVASWLEKQSKNLLPIRNTNQECYSENSHVRGYSYVNKGQAGITILAADEADVSKKQHDK